MNRRLHALTLVRLTLSLAMAACIPVHAQDEACRNKIVVASFGGQLDDTYKKIFKPFEEKTGITIQWVPCLLYTSPSPRDLSTSRMPSSA